MRQPFLFVKYFWVTSRSNTDGSLLRRITFIFLFKARHLLFTNVSRKGSECVKGKSENMKMLWQIFRAGLLRKSARSAGNIYSNDTSKTTKLFKRLIYHETRRAQGAREVSCISCSLFLVFKQLFNYCIFLISSAKICEICGRHLLKRY